MEIDLFPDTALTETVLLLIAFILSGIIGIERDVRQKAAGARTHILVGLGSALFTLVSAWLKANKPSWRQPAWLPRIGTLCPSAKPNAVVVTPGAPRRM